MKAEVYEALSWYTQLLGFAGVSVRLCVFFSLGCVRSTDCGQSDQPVMYVAALKFWRMYFLIC